MSFPYLLLSQPLYFYVFTPSPLSHSRSDLLTKIGLTEVIATIYQMNVQQFSSGGFRESNKSGGFNHTRNVVDGYLVREWNMAHQYLP